MKRRTFFNNVLGTAAGLGLGACTGGQHGANRDPQLLQRSSFSTDDNQVRYYLEGLPAPLKIVQVSDTHLHMDDARGEAYKAFSARMAGAYNSTTHFRTGAATNPAECFEQTLEWAAGQSANLLALTGDIFSFPSEAAVEWAQERLGRCGIPYLYLAGNHDWHYEGMEGSLSELRATWTAKRLSALYQGSDPLMGAAELDGITVLALDNSTYEIVPAQLDFFRRHAASGVPLLLMLHIPLYAPGRPVSWGCGHSDWGAASDDGYEVERRPRWPEGGHTETTHAFYREVLAAPNLLGIFAGHVHRQSMDLIRGIPQFTAGANAGGAFLEINLLPNV